MLKLAIITGFLSRTKDRFHEYNQPLDLDGKFKLMSEMEGFDGVEIVYPYEVSDPAQTRAVLKKHKLKVAAVNVNVKAEPEFRNGGLTSLDRKIRNKAVRFIKEAKDFAEAVGADKVTCCPLGDGYEFAFQHDYADGLEAPDRDASARPGATRRRSRCSSSTSRARPAAAASWTPRPRPCAC